MEQHPAQQGAGLFLGHAILCQEIIQQGLIWIQTFITLGEITDSDAIANLRFAAQSRHFSQNRTQQGRLAAAVRSNQPRLFTPVQDQVCIPHQHIVTVTRV